MLKQRVVVQLATLKEKSASYIHYFHLCTDALERGMNISSLCPRYGLKSVETVLSNRSWQLVKEKDNSNFKAVYKTLARSIV